MRKILILVAMLSIVLFSYGTSQAASSSIDNLPGGAGVAYFQVGGGWETYTNIQNVNASLYQIVHIALWDGNSVKLWDWNVCLTPLDNVGIVLQSGAVAGQVRISDYSDTPAGFNTVPVLPLYVTTTSGTISSGIAYGYMTAVATASSATSCANAATFIPIFTGTSYTAWDDLFMRTAILTPTEAFAMNNPMLQGFLNIPSVNELSGVTTAFYDHTALAVQSCSNLDGNVAAGTTYGSLDDPNGANLDWFELLITRNDVARILVTGGVFDGCTFLNALGSSNFYYWGRYNENTVAGTNTNLITVAPDKSRAPGTSRWNHLSAASSQLMYNDDEVANSTNVSCTVEVCFTPFGSGFNELNPGLNTAGEARIYIPFPIFGFTYTYTSAYADLYPLVKERMLTYSQPPTGTATLNTFPQF